MQDRFDVAKAFLFIGYVAENQSLYTALQKLGYIVIFKPTLILPNKKVKGNVDAELVLHTMIELSVYQQAVIVSGDGDFYCLIEYLLGQKKLCRLIIPSKFKFSSLLRKFNQHITFLNNAREKLQKQKEA
ncbi:MAG: NYN domain-containing protein [Patescibacteria group bacterium]